MQSSDTLFELALRTPYQNLGNICQSNKTLRDICSSEYFWESKALADFDHYLPNIPNLSPQKRYLSLLSRTGCDIGSENFINIDECLKRAIMARDMRVIKYLLGKGADRDVAIIEATNANNLDLVKYLVSTYTDTDENIKELFTENAVIYGNIAIVDYLLSIWSIDLRILLQQAVVNNKLEMVRYLVTKDIPIRDLNESLKMAALKDKVDIVRTLVAAGANDIKGALHIAKQRNAQNTINYLLSVN